MSGFEFVLKLIGKEFEPDPGGKRVLAWFTQRFKRPELSRIEFDEAKYFKEFGRESGPLSTMAVVADCDALEAVFEEMKKEHEELRGIDFKTTRIYHQKAGIIRAPVRWNSSYPKCVRLFSVESSGKAILCDPPMVILEEITHVENLLGAEEFVEQFFFLQTGDSVSDFKNCELWPDKSKDHFYGF